IKWGCCDGVHGGVRPTLEVGVGTLRDEGVPPGHRLLQVGQGDFLVFVARPDGRGQFLDRVGLEEQTVVSGVGRFDIPFRVVNRCLIEDCPDRTGEKMRWLRAFVDGQGSVNGKVVVIDRLDRVGPAVAPISLNVLIPFLDGAILWILARPMLLRNPHLIEESLSHLVDGDQVLEASGADVDSTRATVREVSGPWKLEIGYIHGAKHRCYATGGGVVVALLHPVEGRPDIHPGNDAAGVGGAARPAQPSPGLRCQRRLQAPRVEHGAELRVAIVSAGADDDRLARPDRDGQPFVLDQPLGPYAAGEFAIADELLTSFRGAPRRVARPDTEDPARELSPTLFLDILILPLGNIDRDSPDGLRTDVNFCALRTSRQYSRGVPTATRVGWDGRCSGWSAASALAS